MIGIVGATYDAQYAADGMGFIVTPAVTARRVVASGTVAQRSADGASRRRDATGTAGVRTAEEE
jgi:hypothetical protein